MQPIEDEFSMHRSLATAEGKEGLYIAIPVYFVSLGIIAFFSYRRLHKQIMSGSADHVIGHFLAGRTFGPWTTAGTMFASMFSGYTVVGIPNESFTKGFWGFRWLPAFAVVAVTIIGTGVRLRKASLVRNHQTSVDFLTDRFRSQVLRYSVLTIQVVACIVYLAAQVNALRSTFNAMFGIPYDNVGPVLAIMAIILLMEWCGGLAMIAMSDSFQGFIMAFSFLTISIVIKKNFGGWSELDPLTYPRPSFYQTPTSKEQWSFWQFTLSNIGFFALPHMIMRNYAARDLKSLKVGCLVITLGPWFTMLIGVFIGTVGLQMVHDYTGDVTSEAVTRNPYTAILDVVISMGGFEKVAGIIALTSSIAAIMSTADSLIIAISHLITVECVWPFQKDASNWKVAWIGRLTSLASTALASIMGLSWTGGVAALAAINFPIITQVVPAFFTGLYATELGEFHPWSLTLGAWAGFVFVFLFYFFYLYKNSAAAAVDSGIAGIMINVFVVCLVELVMRRRSRQQVGEKKEHPAWDTPAVERFGEHPLTASLLDTMMQGVPEPLRNVWFVLGFFVSATIVTPMAAEGQPVLNGEQWVSEPPVVNGLPWWFFKQILLCVVPYVVTLTTLWQLPNQYPFDEKKIDTEGINPDTLELTPHEMNLRDKFDSCNDSIRHRRSSVISMMEELGISLESKKEENPSPPMEKRLSTIILKANIPEIEEIEDDDKGVKEQNIADTC